MRLEIAGNALLGARAERARLSPLFRAVAARLAPRDARVGVIWIGERTMARLNRVYKKRTGAAEILTFPCAGAPAPEGEALLGEICLCWPRLVRGARLRGVSPRAYGARASRAETVACVSHRMRRGQMRTLITGEWGWAGGSET